MRVLLKLAHFGFTFLHSFACLLRRQEKKNHSISSCFYSNFYVLRKFQQAKKKEEGENVSEIRKQINKIKLPFALRMIKSELLWVCWFENCYSNSIFIVRHWRNATAQILTQIILFAFLSPVSPISLAGFGARFWDVLCDTICSK